MTRLPAWFVVGPTASGKHAAALELARELGAEIVVLDSMKVYVGMDVGTAKPSAADRAAIPHHALDLVSPSAEFSLEHYLAHIRHVLSALDLRGVPALFAGGTHLYLQALLRGVSTGPPPDPARRAALEARARAGESLWDALRAVDPETALRLHPKDERRIVRALEVAEVAGRPMSALVRGGTIPALDRGYRGIAVVRERADLYARIDLRVRQMFDAGWVDEVRAIEGGGGFGPQAGQAIGYAEIRRALALGCDPATELARIQARTRNFARKQLNWIGRFDELVRVPVSGIERSRALAHIVEVARQRAARPPDEPRGGPWLRGTADR